MMMHLPGLALGRAQPLHRAKSHCAPILATRPPNVPTGTQGEGFDRILAQAAVSATHVVYLSQEPEQREIDARSVFAIRRYT